MFGRLFRRSLGNCILPDLVHSTSPIKSPSPYFRLHVIRSNPSVSKSLLDTLNSRPYRFNFTKEQLKILLQKKFIRIWTSSSRVEVLIPHQNDVLLDKLIKKPLEPYSVITFNQHIHETPVPTPTSLKMLSSFDDELIAVNKPCGVPVHGVQKYYYNTIQSMLANQQGCRQSDLYPLHRLDRLTSGVLLWASNGDTVSKFKDRKAWIHNKIYLARINGRLPLSSMACNDDLVYIYPTRKMVRVYPNAVTNFKEVCYDETRNESLVVALLNSGFPHQIRIHLRNLGSPIVDDPLYGLDGKYKEIIKNREDITDAYWKEILQRSENIRNEKLSKKSDTCLICDAPQFYIPDEAARGKYAICLHAWIYKYKAVTNGPYAGEKHMYEAPIPRWAIPKGTGADEVAMLVKRNLNINNK